MGDPAGRDCMEACRTAYPPMVKHEYTRMFFVVGRAEIKPYLSGSRRKRPARPFWSGCPADRRSGLARRGSVSRLEGTRFGISDGCLVHRKRRPSRNRAVLCNLPVSRAIPFMRGAKRCVFPLFKPVAAFALAFSIERQPSKWLIRPDP